MCFCHTEAEMYAWAKGTLFQCRTHNTSNRNASMHNNEIIISVRSTPQADPLPTSPRKRTLPNAYVMCTIRSASYVHGHHRFTYPPPSRAVRHIHQAECGRQDFVVGVDDLNVNGTGARLKVETEFGGEKSLQMMHGYGGWTL